jgi:hypothetical protein
VLQSSKFPDDPEHSRPPFAGFGLSHILDRDRLPPPQVLEQEPHACHAPQAPSTIYKENEAELLFDHTCIARAIYYYYYFY